MLATLLGCKPRFAFLIGYAACLSFPALSVRNGLQARVFRRRSKRSSSERNAARSWRIASAPVLNRFAVDSTRRPVQANPSRR